MRKYLLFGLLFSVLSFAAQTKPTKTKIVEKQKVKMIDPDSLEVEEEKELPILDFKVYTKPAKTPGSRTKLCLNLISGDSILKYCINDSILRDPELYKVLFKEIESDTSFFLVYASAFSKAPEKPECGAGKESKLFFVRWCVKNGQAIVKYKSVESCMRGITNMTIDPIQNWGGRSVLKVNFHKGGTSFSELTFDPNNFRLGIQTVKD